MNFLLVYPPLNTHTTYWHPHLGLGYISAILTKNGHKTLVLDTVANNWSFKDFKNFFLKTKEPDVVLITATTSEIDSAHKIASIVKKQNEQIVTIVGGPHTTALPRLTLHQFKNFDIAICGEGEYTIIDIAKSLKNNAPLKKVKGIAFRQNDKIILNEKRELILDLDKLPFPEWEKFPVHKYKSYAGMRKLVELPLITGRGCPNQCVFCQHALGSRVRVRHIDSIIEEIEHDIGLGAESIYFCDETFSLIKPRTTALLKEMIKRKIGRRIFWHCETRVDCVNEELMSLLKKAGCKLIHFGVESGSDYILQKAKKGITTKQIINTFKTAKKFRLKTYMFLIFGLPFETKKTIQETIDLMMKVNPDYVTIGILVPFPGTEVVDMAKKGIGGLNLLTNDWRLYTKQSGNSLSLKGLSSKELKRLQTKAYIKFYFRPSKILNLFELARPFSVLKFVFDMSEIAPSHAPSFSSEKEGRFLSMLKNTPRPLGRGVFDRLRALFTLKKQ